MHSLESFEDHFSKNAELYAKHRPSYPDGLFEYLVSVSPGKTRAWDCGTGNGQAAESLTKYFDRVIATDASEEQIAQAADHPKITYKVEPAEQTTIESGSVDLVTVAVAIHWFDFDPFYAEVRRVLKPDGILAAWAYYYPIISPKIDTLLKKFSRQLTGYWPERFHYLDERYETLPFPFKELNPPDFSMSAKWTLDQLCGFLTSWSATRRYIDSEGKHPLDTIWPELSESWGDAGKKTLNSLAPRNPGGQTILNRGLNREVGVTCIS